MCQSCGSGRRLTRRGFIGSAAGAMLAAGMPTSALAFSGHDTVPPDVAWERLVAGNERYVSDTRICTDYALSRASLALGQNPFAAVLSCADSRVVPEMAFDQMPGDLFTIRVAGNFVSDDGIASLEYAIEHLGTRLIVVMGHSNCGAVGAAIEVVRDHAELPGHLMGMMREIRPAVETALQAPGDDLIATAVNENVKRAVARLEAAGPILGPAIAEGRIGVVGATYDLATGRVSLVPASA